MNHNMGLDPYTIRVRNDELLREVQAIRLRGSLRKDRSEAHGSRVAAFATRAVSFIRGAGFAASSASGKEVA
jgi:hypothetical protein